MIYFAEGTGSVDGWDEEVPGSNVEVEIMNRSPMKEKGLSELMHFK